MSTWHWVGACGAQGGEHRRQGADDHTVHLLSALPSSLAGVNSFMVYMAYKDWYQVSNTEVTTHHVWFGVSGWVSVVASDLGFRHVSHCGSCGRTPGKEGAKSSPSMLHFQ